MTAPTGRARGRPKGALNRATREQRDRAAASGLLPHEFLLAVTRGETIDGHVPTFEDRLEAAKAAAPFFAPKMSAVTASLQYGHKSANDLTDDELAFIATEGMGEKLDAFRKAKASGGGKH